MNTFLLLLVSLASQTGFGLSAERCPYGIPCDEWESGIIPALRACGHCQGVSGIGGCANELDQIKAKLDGVIDETSFRGRFISNFGAVAPNFASAWSSPVPMIQTDRVVDLSGAVVLSGVFHIAKGAGRNLNLEGATVGNVTFIFDDPKDRDSVRFNGACISRLSIRKNNDLNVTTNYDPLGVRYGSEAGVVRLFDRIRSTLFGRTSSCVR